MSPTGERAGAIEHGLRSVDGDDARRPSSGLNGQVALAAAEIRDLHRRQEEAQCARPRRPAAARHQLAPIARVRAAMRLEILFSEAQHLLQPRFVGPHVGVTSGLLELLFEAGPERAATAL